MKASERRNLASLTDIMQALSRARELGDVLDAVKTMSRQITGADGATLVLREGDSCHYVDEDAIAPLWKGQRFPMRMCISGWSMLNREPAIVADISEDRRIPLEAYRATFVRSLAMVPIRRSDPIGAIGHYWAESDRPTTDHVTMLEALAEATALALDAVHLRGDLRQISSRTTAQLDEMQGRLAGEMRQRLAAEERIRLLSQSDALTGLYNRHGFLEVAGHGLRGARLAGRPGWVLCLDIEGLGNINALLGDREGDRILVGVADALRRVFARNDVIGRIGDDEFAVFGSGTVGRVGSLIDELGEAVARLNGEQAPPIGLSIGCAWCPVDSSAECEVFLRAAGHALTVDRMARRFRRRR